VPLGVAARGCGASLGLAVRGAQEAADQQNCGGQGGYRTRILILIAQVPSSWAPAT
jgi:hypothetical protein